jgi:hypothetical protein
VAELSRRRLLQAGAATAASAAIGALGGCSHNPPRAGAIRAASPTTSSSATTSTTPSTLSGLVTSSAIEAENALPGTPNWDIPDDPRIWDRIRGFASATSVDRGGTVQLFVTTAAPSWQVQAVRMGWYGGVGGRVVWESPTLPGEAQPPPVMDPVTRMVDTHWRPNYEVTAGADWPPGVYLLKLVTPDGPGTFIPLTVRDDANTAAYLVQNSVTTWQAYNTWGGASLYMDEAGRESGRSKVVTFDRPYYRKGWGEFNGREMDFIRFVERHGLDVTYWTDIDLHADPAAVTRHRALISLAHDEYYSPAMRKGLEDARDAGTNLVFLGANACFRKIRLEPSATGAFRHQVNYRVAHEDPMYGVDNSQVTVNWRNPPSNDPESSLIGNYYESNPVDADLVIGDADSWFFEGTGLRNGDRIPHVVGNEYDRVTPEAPTPPNIQVLCHSPVVCNGRPSFSDMTWYTASSGAGVFGAGTFNWEPHLGSDASIGPPSVTNPDAAIQRATLNLLSAVGGGPAGVAHPSENNLATFGIHPGYIPHPPGLGD